MGLSDGTGGRKCRGEDTDFETFCPENQLARFLRKSQLGKH